MSLPAPVPLDLPPADPAALDDVVAAVTGAAFGSGVLAAHLAGPASTAPGWLGADAAAAAGQIGTVTALVGSLHDALTAAEERLRAHARVLGDARRRIGALRRAQEEDFAGASARLAAWADPDAAGRVLDDLAAAEEARRREHAALLDQVGVDAAATAQVLADATTGLGGTGGPGHGDRVRAALAARLPGWGDGELIARAWDAARALDGPVTADDVDRVAREGLAYAGSPAYAGALLADLGVDGVRWLLTALGQEAGPSDVLARWLAAAFGAAEPPASGSGPLADVLDARYVDPDDPDGVPDDVAFGMAALLAAAPAAAGGVPGRTAAGWGAQVLARERSQGVAAVDRRRPTSPDPVEVVVERLAAGADPTAAATLLAGRESWDALLARSWDDDAAALRTLVRVLPGAGPDGAGATRAALEALGHGLSQQSGVAWTVDRTTAAELRPALAAAVAAHAGVATDVLAAAGAGEPLAAADDDALRGLAYLTLDPDAAAAVQAAVDASALDIPAAVVARGALVAAREYAQRLEHAIEGYVAMAEAVDRQFTYDVVVRLPFEVVDGLPGKCLALDVVGELVSAGASWLDADGTWALVPDTGLVLDREDAGAAVAPLVAGAAPAVVERTRAQARAAFDAATAVLGVPSPPRPVGPALPDSTPVETKQTQLERLRQRN